VQLLQQAEGARGRAVEDLPYRAASFEMIAYLQPPGGASAAGCPAVPLSQVAALLAGRGCCIIGGRADEWKRQGLLQQLEQLGEDGGASAHAADMLSLQTVNLGADDAPFQEYPGEAQFKEESALREEHGEGTDDLDDIIVDCPVTRPYYIALMRRR
jgi:hypothetical protein